jgi:FAD dependent oxidoreductase
MATTSCPVFSQKSLQTDVLVIGGGTGGIAAGLQSARMGVSTIIAEPTTWLGGMFSSAGVAAFDGNHHLPSGIWAEFREQLYKVYGGADKVATGWVSNTLFEPHLADSILKVMAGATPQLKILYQYDFIKILKKGTLVKGAVFYNNITTATDTIFARQIIDATELGDVMADAGIPFDIGMEASSNTGENMNVTETNDIIQDMTYAAILKDYGTEYEHLLSRPAEYDSMEFDGCCKEFCSNPVKTATVVSARQMLDYGKLPNDKYLINWPNGGNDIYLNIIGMNALQRKEALKKAKAKTMRFIYFLQHQLGFKQLGLADDEFATTDQLPLMPYHREGRRLKGLVRFNIQYIADPFAQSAALFRTGISVGDYPVDHHHQQNPQAPKHLGFYPVPSFNVPLGALIPQKYQGIIIAEKGISVSNIVNGTTRLQPCVLLTGQAAGVLAALCVKQKKQAAQISVREVQKELLKSKAYIMPYCDVKPNHPHFAAIQKTGATGILKGKGIPYKWSNQTWFYPDSTIETNIFIKDFEAYNPVQFKSKNKLLTVGDLFNIIALCDKYFKKKLSADNRLINKIWISTRLAEPDITRAVKRFEIAAVLDKILMPFEKKLVDHQGHFIRHAR